MVDRFASVLAGICLFITGLAASSAAAHEGHDHGAPPPPVSTTIAPRADASTADLELVAVARGERLEIFLDSFKGNEPIDGATLEIDGPGGGHRGIGGHAATAFVEINGPGLAAARGADQNPVVARALAQRHPVEGGRRRAGVADLQLGDREEHGTHCR